MGRKISLNTDIGEGFGRWKIVDDDTLLELATDANLACGAHASDPDIMRHTCTVAAERGITIGAQVGYFDIRGFGRRYIEMDPASLTNDILYQLGALSAFTSAAGIGIGYLKIHGALEHAAIARRDYAEAIVEAVRIYDPTMPFMCQPGTALTDVVAAGGLTTIAEGYIDRAYTPDGLLVPRGQPGAMITDPDACAARAVRIATDREIECIDGTIIPISAASVCIHSDSPGAIEIARAVRGALEAAGVNVASLA